MIPDVMYHGTFKVFDSFNPEFFDKEAYCGPGIYLTNEFCDANDFYANENSGDTSNKIDKLVEIMDDGESDYDEIYDKAKQEIVGEGKFVYHCQPKVSNPVILSKCRSEGTYIELWQYTDDNEEPELTEAYHTINEILGSSGIDFCPDDCEISAYDLLKICQELQNWDDITPGELFQEIVKALGFDSILMRNAETFFSMYRGYSELHHLIIFSPDNVEIVNREEI